MTIWVSKTAFPLQISEGQKIFFRNPDKRVSKTMPFVQMSEGVKIFLRGGCAKAVSKFLISEGVQIEGVIPNKRKEVVIKTKNGRRS